MSAEEAAGMKPDREDFHECAVVMLDMWVLWVQDQLDTSIALNRGGQVSYTLPFFWYLEHPRRLRAVGCWENGETHLRKEGSTCLYLM